MAILQSIILGTIQGITEFLPISSSAHLVLVPWIFGWNYMGLGFDTALHFGTAIAIVAFFWRDWLSIITRAIKPNNELGIRNNGPENKNHNSQFIIHNSTYPPNLLWQILVASIPAAIAGYLLSDYVETYLHSPILLAVNLAVFGIVLWLVDVWAQKKGTKRPQNYSTESAQNCHPEQNEGSQQFNNIAMSESASGSNKTMKQPDNGLPLNKITFFQSFYVGLAQTLALVPGVSRSGITITAARGLGMNRENSARFSFILSAPATVGAFLFEARKVDWAQTTLPFWLAIIVTVIVGLLTIKYLLKYLQRGSFLVFTVYRVILAIVIIAIFLMR